MKSKKINVHKFKFNKTLISSLNHVKGGYQLDAGSTITCPGTICPSVQHACITVEEGCPPPPTQIF